MRVSERWKRFNRGFYRLQARRPVAMGFAQGLLVGLVLACMPGGSVRSNLVRAAFYALGYAAFSAYFWRPGGFSRRQYERWCARLEGTVPIADGGVAPGWYGDPARGGRIAYWNGKDWV